MILINGKPKDHIAVTDRGLAYGDGVFRTLPVYGGQAFCWRAHHAKLCADCERLGIPAPDGEILSGEVTSVAKEITAGTVKIIITRGEGERGYALPSQAAPTRIVISGPLPVYPTQNSDEGIKARLCELRLADQPRLAGVKHLNRLENVLARAEWRDSSITEGLLLDRHGNVIEGVMSNLFILRQDTLLTPDLSRCGVAGVTRERILAWAAKTGISHKIQDIPLDALWDAEEIMVCNSLIGVWNVREIDGIGKTWGNSKIMPLIREYLAMASS